MSPVGLPSMSRIIFAMATLVAARNAVSGADCGVAAACRGSCAVTATGSANATAKASATAKRRALDCWGMAVRSSWGLQGAGADGGCCFAAVPACAARP